MTAKLGILAGGGRLPGLLIEACKRSGREYFVLAFSGQAEPDVIGDAPQEWVRMGAAGKGFAMLHERGVKEIVLAGRVKRPTLTDLRPDLTTIRFFARVGIKGVGDDGLLRALINELEERGFKVIGADEVLPSLKAVAGPLGAHEPDSQAEADIARGVAVLCALGDMDVGQAVIVQQGIVLGLEAVEGTDALLRRCVALKRDGPGGVLVKLSKEQQETRVDLPTIGPDTVSAAAEAGLRGIAIEAGATIVLDPAELARAADKAGLFVVGISARQ